MVKLDISGNGRKLMEEWAKTRYEMANKAVIESIAYFEECERELKAIQENRETEETVSKFKQWYNMQNYE